MAQSLLSAIHTWRATWSKSPDAAQEKALAISHSVRARDLAPRNPYVLTNCADTALYSSGNIDLALELLTAAVSDGPDDPQAMALLANVRRVAGQEVSRSLELIAKAMRLSPRDPRSHRWYHYAGWCFWKAGDLEAMEIRRNKRSSCIAMLLPNGSNLFAPLGCKGRIGEAREAGAILKQHLPDFTPRRFFDVARAFYGSRFPGQVERDYGQLCQTLARAI
jgi:tetratricopeptide (TPR) repeat protein